MTTYHLEYRKAENDTWQPYTAPQRGDLRQRDLHRLWFTSERAAVQYALNSFDPRLAYQFRVVEASAESDSTIP